MFVRREDGSEDGKDRMMVKRQREERGLYR